MAMATNIILRKTVDDTSKSVIVPADIEWGTLRNDGDNPIFFNFDGDTTNYWTIKPNSNLGHVFRVFQGEELYYRTLSGTTTKLEIMAWG